MKRYQAILIGLVLLCGIGFVMDMDFMDKVRDQYQTKCVGGKITLDGDKVKCAKDNATTTIGELK